MTWPYAGQEIHLNQGESRTGHGTVAAIHRSSGAPIDLRTPASDPLLPSDPATIGDHTLLGRLGTGGMGTVYLGASEDGRLVAVKVIRREYAVAEDFTARFRSEVEHARAVASFCTAQVLGHGETADGRPYMVTEFIQGTPLDRQIATFGRLEPATLHGVAFGVAAALTAIHAVGLVHRDLKPANVILSMSGPRVIDFGIARAVDATHGHTETGEVVGTPGWWAPEQLRGLPITPAADIFTWGCLVAYAGNGRSPFGEGDPMVLAHRVLETEPDLGSLPEPLDHLVRRALHQEPRHRPTAQELLLALVGGRAEPTTQVTDVIEDIWDPPPNLLPAPKRRRRHLTTALVVAVIFSVATGLLIGLRASRQDGQPSGAGRANDIGRHIEIGDVQVIVQRPACESGERETSCRVGWLVVNMGGTAVDLAGPLDLVDDQGVTHKAVRNLRPEAAFIEPGDMLRLGGEYAIPADRTPARLTGSVVAGGDDIEVRL